MLPAFQQLSERLQVPASLILLRLWPFWRFASGQPGRSFAKDWCML